ncbi:helix-turn-helix transcriptional regulator [Streptomyces sp. NPDC005708]|uniref:helix-turn-helix domain-containing protein n=1 Tax=Streptomyces sp. NPDC005708 TaxID=3154564 RepID=UPI0033DAF0B5
MASGKSNKELSSLLGVSEGAVSQVLNGDGNIRISTLARYLRAMGFEPRLSADPVDGGESLPSAPRRVRSRRKSGSEEGVASRVERMSVSVSRCSVTDGDVVAPALSVLFVMPDQDFDVTRATTREHQETPSAWHVLESPSWLAHFTAEAGAGESQEEESQRRAAEAK